MHVLTKRELEILAAIMADLPTQNGEPPFGGVHIVSNLWRIDLSGAHLSGADLARKNLEGANFSRANLSDADLSNSNLRDSKLRGTNLEGANLKGALIDTPLGMSTRNDSVAKVYGVDEWHIGCFQGNTAETIARLQAEKSGRALRSYLSNMLMMLCNDRLPAETERAIFEALSLANQQCEEE